MADRDRRARHQKRARLFPCPVVVSRAEVDRSSVTGRRSPVVGVGVGQHGTGDQGVEPGKERGEPESALDMRATLKKDTAAADIERVPAAQQC